MIKMNIKMMLLSDAIFGNGSSIPGAEDISILCDGNGFPYYKGGTFKGIFREELGRYLELCGKSETEIRKIVTELLGMGLSDDDHEQIIFSDFTMAPAARKTILEEIGIGKPEIVTDILTNVRTFTKIEKNGVAARGSLRSVRCVDQGLSFYSEISCPEADRNLVTEVLGMIKWVGSMRNRGLGKVRITVLEEVRW